MTDRIPVAILGATGMVGQYFVSLLADHPWFELKALVASDRSAGKPYAEACRWLLSADMPRAARAMTVLPMGAPLDSRVVFSALPSEAAEVAEANYAAAGHYVFSNASSYRMDPLVPILVPEVNHGHAGILREQQRRKGWSGFIVTNPNCGAAVLVTALHPLHQAFGLEKVMVHTMQAVSGAGYPGLSSLDILDNAMPYIGGEEPKLELEPRKILGRLVGQEIQFADFAVSAHCNRVATREGHLECVSVTLGSSPSLEEVAHAFQTYTSLPQQLKLPTAPEYPVIFRTEPDRPQTRLDRDAGKGMSVSVGRLRPCPLLGMKFVALGSNVMRGAAGGSVLNAELLQAQGLLS